MTLYSGSNLSSSNTRLGRLRSTGSCTMQSSPGTVFVDTSAWKAFYDENDDWHKEARGFMNSIGTKQPPIRLFVTSDYVMDETLTLVRFAHSHSKAVEFANTISSEPPSSSLSERTCSTRR